MKTNAQARLRRWRFRTLREIWRRVGNDERDEERRTKEAEARVDWDPWPIATEASDAARATESFRPSRHVSDGYD